MTDTQRRAIATSQRQLTILIPSFRDTRIVEAISSVRAFDDCDSVRILVIDGGSPPELVKQISSWLTEADILISEPDDGIFDGLNKGLERIDGPYMGWLGTDDLFSGEVRSSEVIAALKDHDLFIASLAFIDTDRVQRITHSWPAASGLYPLGLHNPHYATFGRTALLTSERFDVKDVSADQDYFMRIFRRAPRVAYTSSISTLQGVGGFSNSSFGRIRKLNRRTFEIYRNYSNTPLAALAVTVKLSYKGLGQTYFRLRRIDWRRRFPIASRAQAAAQGSPVLGERTA